MPSSIDAMQLASDPREERNPMAVYARGQLRDAMDKYATLRAQVQAAQIDLETAQAAFKYRYRVLSPAQVPRKPTKPSVPLLSVLALLSGLLSAVVVVTIVEVRAGRLVERWQIETLLGAPVLGQIELPLIPKQGTG
jgi:capsular polysaccharide biosynthesis protein